MGTQTLYFKNEGDTFTSADYNNIINALLGHLPPRGLDGSPSSRTHDLGTEEYPYRILHAVNLSLNDGTNSLTITPTGIFSNSSSGSNSIATAPPISAENKLPNFLNAEINGDLTIIASNELLINIKGQAIILNNNIVISAFTGYNAASISANVKFDYYDANDPYYKIIGLDYTAILLDNLQAEWLALAENQAIAWKNGGEISFGRFRDSSIFEAKRGYFFGNNKSANPAEGVGGGGVIQLLRLGWVFIDADGATTDIAYDEPIYSTIEPTSPNIGLYWFDEINLLWKRYNGSSFVEEQKMPVGIVVIDENGNCIATREYSTLNNYVEDLSIQNSANLEIPNTTTNATNRKAWLNIGKKRIYVYSNFITLGSESLEFDLDNADHMEDILTANEVYYLYITTQGLQKIDTQPPIKIEELYGYYHPNKSWRCVGAIETNGSSYIVNEPDFFTRNIKGANRYLATNPTLIHYYKPPIGLKKAIVYLSMNNAMSACWIGKDDDRGTTLGDFGTYGDKRYEYFSLHSSNLFAKTDLNYINNGNLPISEKINEDYLIVDVGTIIAIQNPETYTYKLILEGHNTANNLPLDAMEIGASATTRIAVVQYGNLAI